jgi:hypothetical protein
VREHGTAEVPLHLRNAPTKLMKQLGYGREYQYDHDAEGGIALGQTGFPDAMGERVYYQPVERGLEIKLKEKLDALRAARAKARGEVNWHCSGWSMAGGALGARRATCSAAGCCARPATTGPGARWPATCSVPSPPGCCSRCWKGAGPAAVLARAS